MLFSSFLFLFLFLPLILPFALVRKVIIQNYVLLLASLIFDSWGGVSYSIIIVASILLNYFLGILISRLPNRARLFLSLGVIINVGILCFFKYLNLLISSFNDLVPH